MGWCYFAGAQFADTINIVPSTPTEQKHELTIANQQRDTGAVDTQKSQLGCRS